MSAAIVSALLFAFIAAGTFFYLYKSGCDRITIYLTLLALLLIGFHLHSTTWTEFAVDAPAHMEYVEFLLNNRRLPMLSDGVGPAARHPPAYYILSAAVLGSTRSLELPEPEQIMRYVSVALYAVFLLAGIQILRLLLYPQAQAAYFASLVMLLFWPVGITIASRVTCDLLLYAGQAGTLYALIRWLETRPPSALSKIFFWSGVAVMGKNSGIVMLGFALLALLVTIYEQHRNLKSLLRTDLAIAILFAFGSTALTLQHGWIMKHVNDGVGIHYHWDYLLALMGSFNIFIFVFDSGLGLGQESFWNVWLHTLLFGNTSMGWNASLLLVIYKMTWLGVLVYAVEGLIRARKALSLHEKTTLLLFGMFIAFMIAGALFLLLRTANINYADARYGFPAVIGFALTHGIVMKHHLQAGRTSAYRVGSMMSALLAGLTMLLFATYSL